MIGLILILLLVMLILPDALRLLISIMQSFMLKPSPTIILIIVILGLVLYQQYLG